MEIFWLAYLFWCVIAGFIGMAIGQSKGRGPLGYVFGFFLGIVGWIIVALLPETYEVQQAKADRIATAVDTRLRADESEGQRRDRSRVDGALSSRTPPKRDFRKEALAEVLRTNPSLAEDTSREGLERLQAEVDTTQKHLELRSEVEALQADKQEADRKAAAAQRAAEAAGIAWVPTGVELIAALRSEFGFTLRRDDLIISSVERGSPAEKLGVQSEDRLLSVNGVEVTKQSDLSTCVRDFRIHGGVLRFGVQRGPEFLDFR